MSLSVIRNGENLNLNHVLWCVQTIR